MRNSDCSTDVGSQQGFSLLEVIVALAILGLCVTVLLQIFAGVAGVTRLGDDYYKALQIAETQLALLAAEENSSGITSGRVDEQFRWQTVVEEYKPDLNSPLFSNSVLVDSENNFVPYHLEVTVTWGGVRKRHLTLSTIRLGVAN